MPAHDGADIAKVLYIGDPADLAVVAEQMRVRFGDALYVTYSLPDCLEVMTANVSKGRALRSVLARLGVDTGHCIAFGDNMNDIDLLETAGHAFMMNNANPGLVARLPHIPRIGNNFDAGVARHLHAVLARRQRRRLLSALPARNENGRQWRPSKLASIFFDSVRLAALLA